MNAFHFSHETHSGRLLEELEIRDELFSDCLRSSHRKRYARLVIGTHLQQNHEELLYSAYYEFYRNRLDKFQHASYLGNLDEATTRVLLHIDVEALVSNGDQLRSDLILSSALLAVRVRHLLIPNTANLHRVKPLQKRTASTCSVSN